MEFYLLPLPSLLPLPGTRPSKKGKKRLRNVVVLFLKADRPIKRKAEAEAKKKRENESLAGIMDSTDGNISRPTL